MPKRSKTAKRTVFRAKQRALKITEPQQVGSPKELDKILPMLIVRMKESVVVVEEKKEAHREITVPVLLLKGIFKADHPYRTKIGQPGLWNTSSAGVLNITAANSAVSSGTEWSSLDLLFDEFFIHSMEIIYQPFNRNATIPPSSASWSSPAMGLLTTTTEQTAVYNAGAMLVCIFGGNTAYSSQTAMIANPSRKFVHTSEPFRYKWKNNVKFEPRGISLNPGSGFGWQGWTTISSSSNYGGLIQFRALNDQVFGDGSHTLNIGTVNLLWDISFRARA